jgi:hypothetical protein
VKRKVSQRAKARQKMPGGMWLMALFAAPFAVAGLAILMLMVAPAVYDWARMQSWQPVPAKVELALVQNHPARRGRVDHTVSVRYRYQFGALPLQGHAGFDQRAARQHRALQQRLGGRLRDAMNTESPVQIWVNPQILLNRLLIAVCGQGCSSTPWCGLWPVAVSGC